MTHSVRHLKKIGNWEKFVKYSKYKTHLKMSYFIKFEAQLIARCYKMMSLTEEAYCKMAKNFLSKSE